VPVPVADQPPLNEKACLAQLFSICPLFAMQWFNLNQNSLHPQRAQIENKEAISIVKLRYFW
jgi:hypothetical protein